MSDRVGKILDGVLLLIVLGHLLAAPWTKVEESFNMQAVHDFLYYGLDVSRFDHLEFPGVVPRTFITPLALTSVVILPLRVLRSIPAIRTRIPDGIVALFLTRFVIGLLSVLSISSLRRGIAARYTVSASYMFALFVGAQFHTLFYASRSLPNTFALALTNLSLSEQVHPSGNYFRCIALLCFACALLRSELCILIVATIAVDFLVARGPENKEALTFRLRRLFTTVSVGLVAGVTAAVTSLAVDSFFWRRLSYPELEVFYFNAVLNKSHAWGTLPWHWYFTNALPRTLLGAFPFAILGCLRHGRDLLPLLGPALFYVVIYSILPHKELRFVFYAVPPCNIAAALGLDWLYRRVRSQRSKSRNLRSMAHLCALSSVGVLLATTLATGLSAMASHHNYPGGHALTGLHKAEHGRASALIDGGCRYASPKLFRVHIDTYAATTGVSRFLEMRSFSYSGDKPCVEWEYSRAEHLRAIDWITFTHLVTERSEVSGFTVIHNEHGYDGVVLSRSGLRIRTSPKIYVHIRNDELTSTEK
jgi:alpha-1,6-mannosyltransferase